TLTPTKRRTTAQISLAGTIPTIPTIHMNSMNQLKGPSPTSSPPTPHRHPARGLLVPTLHPNIHHSNLVQHLILTHILIRRLHLHRLTIRLVRTLLLLHHPPLHGARRLEEY